MKSSVQLIQKGNYKPLICGNEDILELDEEEEMENEDILALDRIHLLAPSMAEAA